MSYYNMAETEKRLAEVRKILKAKGLDAALIYFDELNVANGWYLTGWCGQFEKGAVLVPIEGEPYLLGGPESEPFAQMNSAITKVRCFPVFMVPNEEYPNAVIINFKQLDEELRAQGTHLRRIGFVGTATIPHQVYVDFPCSTAAASPSPSRKIAQPSAVRTFSRPSDWTIQNTTLSL